MEIFKKSKELRRSLAITLFIAIAVMLSFINTANNKIETQATLGPVGSIAIGAIGGALKNSVTTKSMNGMTAWLDEQYAELTGKTSEAFFERFAPDIETFFTFTGTEWNTYAIFRTLGTVIAILITIFMFWMIALGTLKVADVKETPLQLMGGLLVSLSIIFLSQQFAELFFDITQTLWVKMKAPENLNGVTAWTILGRVMYPAVLTGALWGTSIEDVAGEVKDGKWFAGLIDGIKLLTGADDVIKPIVVLVNLILGLIFAKEVLNFMVEIVERYIVACLLAVFMPVAAGTIPSKTTRTIFGKYMQMFVSQLFLLLMNALFMMGVLKMAEDGGILMDGSITGWIFMFAYMRAAQRMDRYMFTMGLSVAVTGGNVFDSIGSSLRQLGGLLRGGQAGMEAAGGALVRAGVSGLNPGMAQLGRRIKDFSHPIKSLASGQSIMGGTAGFIQAAKQQGNLQEVLPKIRPEMMDASLARIAFAGGVDAQALTGMSAAAKQQLLNNMYGANAPQLSNIQFTKFGTQTGVMTDENGNRVNVTIGGDKGGKVVGHLSAQTPELKGEMFDIHSDGIGKAGEVIGIAGAEDFDRASILTGVDINGIADEDVKANLDHITLNSDGSASLYGMVDDLDENGDVIGQHEELMARSYRGGLVYDNGNALDNSEGQMEKAPVFSDLHDIKMCVEPGKAENMSDAVIHLLGEDNDGVYHDYAMYNMAHFGDDYKPVNGKYVGNYGGYNDESTGYYRVYDESPEHVEPRDTNIARPDNLTDEEENDFLRQEEENRRWNERNKSKIDAYDDLVQLHTGVAQYAIKTRETPPLWRNRKGK